MLYLRVLYYLCVCVCVRVCVLIVLVQTNFSTVFLEVKRTHYSTHFSDRNFVFSVKSAAAVIGKISVSFAVSKLQNYS